MTNIPVFIGFILLLMGTFWAFDAIVRLECHYHHSAWDQDGRPHGFFWTPEESVFTNTINLWARHRCVIVWLFSTPEWTRDDINATLFIWRFRLLALTWAAGIIFLLLRSGG